MKKLSFEVKIYHQDGETSLKCGIDLAKWIDHFSKVWIESHGVPEGGVFQAVRKGNGAAIHWLSPVDLDWEYVLTITPVYPTDTKIREIQELFKCVS